MEIEKSSEKIINAYFSVWPVHKFLSYFVTFFEYSDSF